MAEAATIQRVAGITVLRLTANLEGHPDLTERITAATGLPLPSAATPSGVDPVMIWQGPSDLLIAGGSADMIGLQRALDRLAEDEAILAGDASAGLAVFDLTGDTVLPRIVEWMHGSQARRASTVRKLAGLRVTLLSETEPAPRIRLFVDRSYADYFRQWLDATLAS
ncbi:hypothetical protein [Flavisphingomonas formosensis]|uniref:hypothetical protein n=1 Tax=Flavisphingomonas formosensis TaxID=861534 RepID=UPI0012F9D583|nr:hypothetical protein [Sphingomonas formosensis]